MASATVAITPIEETKEETGKLIGGEAKFSHMCESSRIGVVRLQGYQGLCNKFHQKEG